MWSRATFWTRSAIIIEWLRGNSAAIDGAVTSSARQLDPVPTTVSTASGTVSTTSTPASGALAAAVGPAAAAATNSAVTPRARRLPTVALRARRPVFASASGAITAAVGAAAAVAAVTGSVRPGSTVVTSGDRARHCRRCRQRVCAKRVSCFEWQHAASRLSGAPSDVALASSLGATARAGASSDDSDVSAATALFRLAGAHAPNAPAQPPNAPMPAAAGDDAGGAGGSAAATPPPVAAKEAAAAAPAAPADLRS